MADIKISQLNTVTGAAASDGDLIPIVDSSNTKAITFNELKNYLTNKGLGQSVTNNYNNTTVTGTGTGDFYEKRYQRSNAAPSTPSDTPYPPSGWTTSVPAGNQVLWSIVGLIKGDFSGLESSTHWSAPTREGAGQVVFYRDNTGTAPYNGSGGPTDSYIQDGDIWYDTIDNNKIYYYDHTQSPKWVGVFTPFPGIDTSGNVTGIQKATGLTNAFAIVADNFQLVNTNQIGTTANVPFEMDGSDVFIKSAHIRNLDAGVITGGEITAAISLASPVLKAANINNITSVYNQDTSLNGTAPYTPIYTMPAIGHAVKRDSSTLNITAGGAPPVGPQNVDGIEQWWGAGITPLTFFGWNTGQSGYKVNRFGCPNNVQIFLYNFNGYAQGDPLINLNVVYQLATSWDGTNVTWGQTIQAQFPQADLVGGGSLLQQHGVVMFDGSQTGIDPIAGGGCTYDGTGLLKGTDIIRFGFRAASVGTGQITWANLSITCNNL